MKVDGVVIGINWDWSDWAVLAGILFVVFPWIILLGNGLLWFFGYSPMLELTAAKTVFAILNWNIIREIRRKYADGLKVSEIARHFDLKYATVSKVVLFKNWK